MTTKVFLSWSGELSRKIAEELRVWLPAVLQYVRPYFTPNDIDKGTRWDSDIAVELEKCDIRVFCLTSENLSAPWIAFEAGALSKRIDRSRVCTLLVDIGASDVTGPLSRFQHTRFEKDDFKLLLTAINNAAGEAAIETKVLDTVFEKWWPDLKSKFERVLKSHTPNSETKREQGEILEEILLLCRSTQEQAFQSQALQSPPPHHLRQFLDRAVRLALRHSSPSSARDHVMMQEFLDSLDDVCAPTGNCDLWEQVNTALENGRHGHSSGTGHGNGGTTSTTSSTTTTGDR